MTIVFHARDTDYIQKLNALGAGGGGGGATGATGMTGATGATGYTGATGTTGATATGSMIWRGVHDQSTQYYENDVVRCGRAIYISPNSNIGPGVHPSDTWTRIDQPGRIVLTNASTVAWDVELEMAAILTITGNCTMGAPTRLEVGETYLLLVQQDGTGGRTLAWNAVFKWPGGTAPVLSTAANAIDIFSFVSDGTNMYGVVQKGFA